MEQQKRVIAMHDISCVGKCSITVALPILSAAGIECSLLPTAVLSTHTGGFVNMEFCDLTDRLKAILRHWKSFDLSVQAIYTGYMGSARQIEIAEEMFAYYKNKDKDTLIFVDPVMADNGKMYSGFDKEFAKKMRRLCGKADVIIPNITEATMMLEEQYVEAPYTKEYIEGLLERLKGITNGSIVITGVNFGDGQIGAVSYNAKDKSVNYAFSPIVNSYFHGTGDIFGSALVSGMLSNMDIATATELAIKLVYGSILQTVKENTDRKFGVNFESQLCEFSKIISQYNMGKIVSKV